MIRPEIKVEGHGIFLKNVSAVEIGTLLGGKAFVGQGCAKRCTGDRSNAEVGVLLAFGRALLDLGEQMVGHARDIVEDEYGIEEAIKEICVEEEEKECSTCAEIKGVVKV